VLPVQCVQFSQGRGGALTGCATSVTVQPTRTWEGPRQAAPMQKRVLPACFARTAASYTSSKSMSFVALVPVDSECLLLWLQ
jgi:hypothetical protein